VSEFDEALVLQTHVVGDEPYRLPGSEVERAVAAPVVHVALDVAVTPDGDEPIAPDRPRRTSRRPGELPVDPDPVAAADQLARDVRDDVAEPVDREHLTIDSDRVARVVAFDTRVWKDEVDRIRRR